MESRSHLRKNNRIHSSLKIEANSLSLGQVRDVINGKTVLGEQKEIQEVKNAYVTYEKFAEINLYSIKDLKKFHYEFVFIHPFADGSGRMARLWHTAILYNLTAGIKDM